MSNSTAIIEYNKLLRANDLIGLSQFLSNIQDDSSEFTLLLQEAMNIDGLNDSTFKALLTFPGMNQNILTFNRDGYNALHHAAETNNWKAIILFAEYITSDKINILTQDNYKRRIGKKDDITFFSPMMLACINNNRNAIYALLYLYDAETINWKIKDTKKHSVNYYLTDNKYAGMPTKLYKIKQSQDFMDAKDLFIQLQQIPLQKLSEVSDKVVEKSSEVSSTTTSVRFPSPMSNMYKNHQGLPEDIQSSDSIAHTDNQESQTVNINEFIYTINKAMDNFLARINSTHPSYINICKNFVAAQRKHTLEPLRNESEITKPISEMNIILRDIVNDAQAELKTKHFLFKVFLDCLMIATMPLGLGLAITAIKRCSTGYSFFYFNHPDLVKDFNENIKETFNSPCLQPG